MGYDKGSAVDNAQQMPGSDSRFIYVTTDKVNAYEDYDKILAVHQRFGAGVFGDCGAEFGAVAPQ